ncbi:membrane protein insertase YidC [Aliidiomarina taiwanensis]|uniref:Membrane protein insertase YidC n=1 Tax=Aliidiomarina taiwanensis TaxID=946228 RepID=A0A432X8W5_9GAMM|nr:membrane protein insertase YidC [Aliidiomarina taiwanensis]RUO43691.1 membrane protein insertase YidC [Aliidiomarina taiwanensis]
MDSRRTLLIILFLVMSFFMYQQWTLKDVAKTPGIDSQSSSAQAQTVPNTATSNGIPQAGQSSVNTVDTPSVQASEVTDSADTVRVTTDLFDIRISLSGGDIVRAELLEHAKELGEDARYSILFQEQGAMHIAESGLTGPDGFDNASTRPQYTVSTDHFRLTGDTLRVPLTYTAENGSTVTKEYVFTRGDYAVDVHHKVNNNTNTSLNMALFGRLTQTMVSNDRSMFMPTYRGAAYSSENDRYKKYSFKDIKKRNLEQNTSAGWVAMLEHYFVTAWVPDQNALNYLRTSTSAATNAARISFVGPVINIPAGSQYDFESQIYMGPKDQERLAELANHLDLTVDYGFLWWLAQPIHWLIAFLFGFVKNYGVAIILITIIIKGLLYPLTKAQHTSMAKMRKIAPRMAELKERFGDDKQKMSQAMMSMYKEEKVNPLGGCLPMFLQLPIFLALYWVLLESPEIRHADFALWINDLSSRDPYFILPLLMGASMYFMQRLQPTPMTDPMQQKIMQMMPVVFTVFFLFFPAGLVLYWLVSNLITIAQMLWIYRQFDKKGLK